MQFFILKENILLWCSQPSILPTRNITQQIFLFDGLAWKHASTKMSSQQLYALFFILWRGLKRKHYSTQIVVTAIIKCLSKKYFLFYGPAWKCFVVYIISHKRTTNTFVWLSGLKTLFHGDYWFQQYILVAQEPHT